MKYHWAFEVIDKELEENPEFTGRFELNFFKGNITNINKLQSIKPEPKKEVGNETGKFRDK